MRAVLVTAALMAAAGAALAGIHELTRTRIEANARAAEREIVRELTGVPAEVPETTLLLCDRGFTLRRGSAAGYGGGIDFVVAFSGSGEIAGVRVIEHAETPGFADILDAGSDWLAGFAGDAGAVHAVTGATITSRALIGGVAAAAVEHGAGGGCPRAREASP